MRPADNRGVHHARGDDADLSDTAGQSTRELIVRLLHRVETLSADLHSMRAESQRLSEEISRLKSRQDHMPADPAPREAPAGTRARRDKPDTPPIDWSVARTADVPAIQPLIVYTLGRFAVYRGDTPIEDSAWQRQKAKKLFKLLLLAPQRQLLKDRVLDLLWPDKSPETAANNLHRTLFILRRVLQPDLENANQSHYLLCKDDMIALHAATIAWVDAEEFVRLIRLGRQQNHNLEHYDAALALYKGEFLPEDVYENWAESQRGVLHKHYVDLLKQVTAIHTERAAYPKAIGNLHALLSLDPTDEAVQRELMRLYAQIGERHKALRLYQQSSQALRDELGVEPSAQTTDLYESILHETLPARFEPLAAAPGEESPAAGEEAYHIPLVGRQAELQQLVEQLGQAKRGHGSMVFLVGEQGVGKTRLAKELVAHARAAGVKTLQGSAFEGEGRLLYAPFVESLRRGLNPQTLDRARQRLGLLVNDLARLLPELLGSAPAGAARPNAAINRLDIAATGQEQRRLFEATAATYALLAQSTPLLLWLENLHAAGDSSLQMLHYLARQIRNQRILVVCTVDQSKLQRGTPISLMLYELQRNHLVERINLARLDPEDVTQLCVHLLDESVRDSNLPAMVYELTGGNPFFVRELVLSLIKIGTIERRNGAWRLPPDAAITIPPNIQEITGARLGQLSGDAYSLLGVAAVIGNEFDYELLQAVTQWERGKLLDTFDEVLHEALVEATEGRYRFQHALIRQVVCNGLSPERRAWLHRQVARALEELAATPADEQATILAHHYAQAGDHAAALRYFIRAGDWARAAHASRESLEHYSHALEIYRSHTSLADGETITQLLERRSQTYLILSDFDSAINDLAQLLKIYQDTGAQARAGETLYQIGFAHYWAHRLTKAAIYLDQALSIAEALDYGELRKRIRRLRDVLNSTQGGLMDSAVADPAHYVEQPGLLNAEEHWGFAMLAHLRCDSELAQRYAQSCIEIGEATPNTFLTLGGYFILGMSQVNLGNYQDALDSLLGALKLSETIGDRFWRARLLNTIGWVYRDLHNLELAIQFDQASVELARASTPRLTEAEGNALANLATTYLLLGQPATARAYVNEGLALSVDEPFMRWRYFARLLIVQGWLALVDGNIAEALDMTDKALDHARATKARKNIARSCILRGKIYMAMGQIDKARAAMRHALSVAQQLKSASLVWSYHLALAGLEQADGQPEAAQAHASAAWEQIERVAAQLTDPLVRAGFLKHVSAGEMLVYAQ